MLIRIDPTSRTPLFEQVASSIRGEIMRGDLVRGDRLPPARELSHSLDINIHTVLRAYQMLRDEGLVELRRGRGALITDAARDRADLVGAIDELIQVARRLGVTREDTTTQMLERWAR